MELNQVDSKIMVEKSKYPKAAIVTLHDAFAYFFLYFKLDFVGSVQPSAGKDPAPKQLQELANKVKAKHIKAIFIEPQMNPKPAEILAQELGIKVLQYDDLGTTMKTRTIADFLWLNWLSLKAGL
jgi:zinc transport system substrate-binding protein